MKFPYLTIVIFSIYLASCTSMDPKVEEEEMSKNNSSAATPPAASTSNVDQKKLIEDYVKTNNIKGEFTATGLFMSIEEPGIGESPTVKNTVTMDYKGYLLNGEVFDQSQPGKPLVYGLSSLIAGWQEGVPKLKKGGKAKLIVPSILGYGDQGSGPIPPNSVLVFDIKLIDFK